MNLVLAGVARNTSIAVCTEKEENGNGPGMTKPLLITLGMLFVALGGVGLVLPVMPTTPFLLLAAACFARSSPRFHARLLDTRLFGPLIRSWQENRSIPAKAKVTAILSIIVVGGASILLFVEQAMLRLLIATILLLNIAFIASLKTSELSKVAEKER